MPEQQSLWGNFIEADTFSFERKLLRQGYRAIAGVDEAGRGPLAGPVVAACVILPPDCAFERFRDSKILTANAREDLFGELGQIGARIGIGVGSLAEINQLNIFHASLLAMKKAIADLSEPPDYLLVDGKFQVPVSLPQQALVKGDSRSASIAAASIIAKVTRDGLMEEYHQRFPQYNFRQNKGYATEEHRRALKECGPCEVHRGDFKGVREHGRDNP